MKKTIIMILFLSLTLTGCVSVDKDYIEKGNKKVKMTDDEIKNEVQRCNDLGLKAKTFRYLDTNNIKEVVCY